MSSKKSYTMFWKESHSGKYAAHRVGRNWYKFNFIDHDLPRCPCCYTLYLDNKLVYIGSTVNAHKRFCDTTHRIVSKAYAQNGQIHYRFITKWGTFDDAYLKIRFSEFIGDWAQKEIYLIDRIRPVYNKMYNW